MAGEKSLGKSPIDSNKNVSFLTRRASLFRMANDLCTLCAVETATVLFSPGDKGNSFGLPSIDAVIDRFHNFDPNFVPNVDHDEKSSDSDEEHPDPTEETQGKRRMEELKQKVLEFYLYHPPDVPLSRLTPEELQEMKRKMDDLEKAIDQRERELLAGAGPSSSDAVNRATADVLPSSGEGNRYE
ncbi:hypothetical protein MLD38_005070 [Melastoma candidum]|uniref:Uncharacterized protein n=1 Tax=Melastoma candidum TaxID=119954 RepID=A0ACB9S783_9MYRT|nr:hypothetical protein MLD38_005070 [Melastoma candidum]